MDHSSAKESRTTTQELRQTILGLLAGRNKRARFMTELYAALNRHQICRGDADEVLAELERAGEVMIRDHFCADPHLSGVDLRVIARVEEISDRDPQLAAIHVIDEVWTKWLGEYLANHRCG
jgi:hypothetical protein